jgi:hypothetical protein
LFDAALRFSPKGSSSKELLLLASWCKEAAHFETQSSHCLARGGSDKECYLHCALLDKHVGFTLLKKLGGFNALRLLSQALCHPALCRQTTASGIARVAECNEFLPEASCVVLPSC